jgi:hypothetical protein
MTLVFTFVTLTVAPGIAAPLESVTIPLMVPNSPWARTSRREMVQMKITKNVTTPATLIRLTTPPGRTLFYTLATLPDS